MAQFTKFRVLVPELRDMVWDLAIRDDRPAAHFYTLCHVKFDLPGVVPSEKVIHPKPPGPNDPVPCIALAAPAHPKGDGGHSWVLNNQSVYLTDSGLWTACRESRNRMLWHFRKGGPAAHHVTMPFQRDGGEHQYMTIRPSQDLLCLDFYRGALMSSSQAQRQWAEIQNFSFFRPPDIPAVGASTGWEQPPSSLRHVAVSFDPMWNKWGAGEGQWVRWNYFRFMAADHVRGLEGFWFINYSLALRYKVDKEVEGEDGRRRHRQTFQAAQGLELVEVRAEDDEWYDRSVASDETRRNRQGRMVAQTWVRDFQDCINKSHQDNVAPHKSRKPCQFGVLACVEQDSHRHLPTKSEWMAKLWGEGSSLPGLDKNMCNLVV